MKKIILFVMILACLTLTFVGCKKNGGEGEETTAATTDANHTHEWGEVEVITAADCRFAGEGKRSCACGAEEKVELPALGHDVPKSSYVENPTFTRGGVQSGVCNNCGKKIRSDAAPLKVAYKNVSANLDSVKNAYFLGFWTDSTTGEAVAAYTNTLGAEIMTKVTGASKVTFNFATSDDSKATIVAYSTNGVDWARKDVKGGTLEVAVPADETVVRVMFVDTEIDLTASGAGLYLKSVAADKGEVAPCMKNGVTMLVISDSATNIEQDEFTRAAESLGYNSYRISRKGLGYATLGAILDAYVAAENKAEVAPAAVMVSLGENDSAIAGGEFMAALSIVVSTLVDDIASDTDIMLIKPISGAKEGPLETITRFYGAVSTVDTAEWATVEDKDELALLIEELLVEKYGEKVFFDGYYEKYALPSESVLPNDNTNNGSFGELKPMDKVS